MTDKRELIGTVTLQSGQKVSVRMPIMRDIIPILGKQLPADEYYLKLIEASTDIERETFLDLDYTDGMQIITLLTSAIELFQKDSTT